MTGNVLAWASAQPEGSVALSLYRAIATGALVVRNANGESVTYRSTSDMMAVLSGFMDAGRAETLRRPRASIARVGGGS